MDTEWEMVDSLEAMKSEGNALFQQKRFVEAVQVYSAVLERLRRATTLKDDQAAQLETAVRLNRAWAWIQMPGSGSDSTNGHEEVLAAAEQDCSLVLALDATCIKAFYRRALVRERRGDWKAAIADAKEMQRLEPGNPCIGPLLERLESRSRDEDNLARAVQQCALAKRNALPVSNQPKSPSFTLKGEAESAWRALQADELQLRETYNPLAQRSAFVRANNNKNTMRKKPPSAEATSKGEISEKTEDIWASLREEEQNTVAKAFSHSKKSSRRPALEAN